MYAINWDTKLILVGAQLCSIFYFSSFYKIRQDH